MKKNKIILVICAFLSVFNACYAGDLGSKIKLHDANSISDKANQNSTIGGSEQNPFVNSMMQGYGNMLKGSTNSSYGAQEEQKLQADYARQQTKYLAD